MVPRARTTHRWPLRPWRSQRKMYVVIYRGTLRRRMRRLVRPRVFNNARTASRNGDLAIRDLHPRPGSSYRISGFWPVHGGHNGGLFLASTGQPASLIRPSDSAAARRLPARIASAAQSIGGESLQCLTLRPFDPSSIRSASSIMSLFLCSGLMLG